MKEIFRALKIMVRVLFIRKLPIAKQKVTSLQFALWMHHLTL